MPKTARFGSFVLDLTSGMLRSGDLVIPIQPAAFQLLTYFVEHPGQLLTREQLVSRLWPDVFVGDEALSQMVKRVRKALGDDGSHSGILVTVPRRGYRFVAQVRWDEPVEKENSDGADLADAGGLDSTLRRKPEHAAVAVSSTQKHPVMVPANAFVGRERFILLVDKHFKEGTRVLTLLGAGGMGKTRLALEFGALQRELGKVVFVDLSEVSHVDGMFLVMGSALDVPIIDDLSHRNLDRIGIALSSGGRKLVILDNFESLDESAANVILRWLHLAPQVLFLITSRRRLGLAAELVLPLEALDTDAACELFYCRATHAGARLSRNKAEVALVSDLVQRLDGSPLAIELVAARAAIMSVAQLLENLSARFLLLSSRQRDAVHRHRSLLVVIESSVERLNKIQRQILIRCALLPGPFTLETVFALGAFLDETVSAWIPDILHDLVDCSLLGLRALESGPPLFVMQESVREYCIHLNEPIVENGAVLLREGLWSRLQAVVRLPRPAADWPTLLEAAKAQVARDPVWAARLALLVAPWLYERGPRATGKFLLDHALETRSVVDHKHQVRLLMARAAYELPGSVLGDRLLGEAEEIAAAQGYAELVLEIGYIKVERLVAQGRYRDAQTILDQLTRPPNMSRFLGRYGALVTIVVKHGLGESNCTDLLKLSDKIAEDTDGIAVSFATHDDKEGDRQWPTLNRVEEISARLADFRGYILSDAGRFDEAIQHYEMALSTYRTMGWRRWQAVTLVNLASPLSFGKRDTEANEALENALEIFDDIGDVRGVAAVLTNRSLVSLLARRVDDARRDIERALPVAIIGELFGIQAVLRHNLSSVMWIQGCLADALCQVELAIKLVSAHGMREREKGLRLWCAGLCAAMGDIEEALEHFKMAERLVADAYLSGEQHLSRVHETLEVVRLHIEFAQAKKNDDNSLLADVTARVTAMETIVGPQAALLASLLPR
ncbi:MAG: winged helix-turn-helix domain-containing protein [Myxococcales bacterium]|nr:winged helix-turn-helix domain-containing protein [Myxococcales bacterium]